MEPFDFNAATTYSATVENRRFAVAGSDSITVVQVDLD